MPMTPREMVKLLEKNGWKPKGNNGGSHRKFENPKTGQVIVVPYHEGRELKKGTEQKILKDAGLK